MVANDTQPAPSPTETWERGRAVHVIGAVVCLPLAEGGEVAIPSRWIRCCRRDPDSPGNGYGNLGGTVVLVQASGNAAMIEYKVNAAFEDVVRSWVRTNSRLDDPLR